MYIGRHREASLFREGGEREIRLPENYAGNAFSEDRKREEPPVPEPADVPAENTACLCEPALREKADLLPQLEKLFSSDALLILLAILLAGSEEGGELAILLLSLLLF